MEPQPEGCGEHHLALLEGQDHRAAMEPQPEGCGHIVRVDQVRLPIGGAAMEPQPEGCGEDGDLELDCDAYLPQWSRSLMAAEKSSVSGCPLPRLVQPQWSPPMMGERTR